MNNLNKVGGEGYKDYNQPPQEEGLIGKTLPLEIFEKVLSYLDDMDMQSASSVNNLWNITSLDVARRKSFSAVNNFVDFISDSLDVNLHTKQINKLSEIVSSKDIVENVSLLGVKEKLSRFEDEIKKVLLTVSDDDLDKLFDDFKGVKKTPLFYKFVFLSKKHKRLHEELNGAVRGGGCTETVKALLEAGAVPTEETLNQAVRAGRPTEMVKALLEAGAVPAEETLNQAMRGGRCTETVNLLKEHLSI